MKTRNKRLSSKKFLAFIQQYNKLATKEILSIEVEKRSDINDTLFAEIVDIILLLKMKLESWIG